MHAVMPFAVDAVAGIMAELCPFLQLLLVAALFLVVPRSGTKGFARLMTPDTFSKAAVKMDTIPEGQGSEAYCVIFDAGSTGPCSCFDHACARK